MEGTDLTRPLSDRPPMPLEPVPPSDSPDRFAASAMKPQLVFSRPLFPGASRIGSMLVAQGAVPFEVSQVGSSTLGRLLFDASLLARPAVKPIGMKPNG